MNSSERQRLEEERLHEEIAELRGELGETVEALVHKADLPARAKERGAELTERALDRGVELQQQAVKRGSELGAQAREWGSTFQGQLAARGGELRDQAISTIEQARQTVNRTSTDTWVKLAAMAGLALVAVVVIMRRVATS
jgi:hypothetical protein